MQVLRRLFFGIVLLLFVVTAGVATYEYHTSLLQSRYFNHLASQLTFQVEAGESKATWFPDHGPYNIQRGYVALPGYIERLKNQGYSVTRQANISTRLKNYLKWGGNPPYQESLRTGLTILDEQNRTLYAALEPLHTYKTLEEIPPLLVDTLLFIENRELLTESYPSRNPAVEWDRLAEAVMAQIQSMTRPGVNVPGGSTLATQMEKYRYSPGGLTIDGQEKIRQMVSASVRAYSQGTDTRNSRKTIVRDYINSTPLAGRSGYGEIHGIGDGLWFWYGLDFDSANRLLRTPDAPGIIDEKARVYKATLSLLLSQRRPSYYLLKGRDLLEGLTDSHLRVLAMNGVISESLRDAALKQPLAFVEQVTVQPKMAFISRKAANNVRTDLLAMLGVDSLYNLDRLDLSVTSSVTSLVQQQVETQLSKITQPDFAREQGLLGEKLLTGQQLNDLQYSVLIYEKSPYGNLLRVQTDNLKTPFDLNEGSKLDLGSTAKLRTLISYLEIIETVYNNHHGLTSEQLALARKAAEDPLRQWTMDYLITHKDVKLQQVLEAAMERNYSASPAESFFTAGGLHRFSNFERKDNTRIMTVSEALNRSVNLVFIRVMRDVARYYTQEIPGYRELLSNESDPRRSEYLQRFADFEGKSFLAQFYRIYGNDGPGEMLNRLAQRIKPVPGRLAMAYRAVLPDTGMGAMTVFMASRLDPEVMTELQPEKLYEQYDPNRFNARDQAYLAKIHPLELWLVKYLLENPGSTFSQVVAASSDERQDAYTWLLKSRRQRAQNQRIQVLLEKDAFASIHKQWQKLGYPFASLVPSYATALGASADRPVALAELMGILVNDGIRKPLRQIERFHFAEGTPYETELRLTEVEGERVLSSEVCQTVRRALAGVVETGTARRLNGVFVDAEGHPLTVGGKTGTGDHRIKTFGPGRRLIAEEAVNRNALFTFYIGDRFFGVILAHVGGAKSGSFEFTSGLAAQLLKSLKPAIQPLLQGEEETMLENDIQH